jgi:hypothetical protein
MQNFVNGAKYAFSTTLSTAVAITAISNAFPAVATASPQPTEGTVVLLDSNWTELNDVAVYAGPTGALANLNTTDTTDFPPGESAGHYRTVGGFVSLSQIREIGQSGGDTNTFNFAYIEDRSNRQRSVPTDKNPIVLTFTLDYDSTLPWFAALENADKVRKVVVMRETLPTGDTLLYTGFLSFNPSPTRTRNENMTVVATMSVNSQIVRYPAGFTGS